MQAAKHQKTGRLTLCIILLLMMIGGVALALIICNVI